MVHFVVAIYWFFTNLYPAHLLLIHLSIHLPRIGNLREIRERFERHNDTNLFGCTPSYFAFQNFYVYSCSYCFILFLRQLTKKHYYTVFTLFLRQFLPLKFLLLILFNFLILNLFTLIYFSQLAFNYKFVFNFHFNFFLFILI